MNYNNCRMLVETPPIEKDLEKLVLPPVTIEDTKELLREIFIEEGCKDAVSSEKAQTWITLEKRGVSEENIASGGLRAELDSTKR